MDVLILRYYNINRFLLLIIGSWPMTNKSFLNFVIQKIIRFIVYSILISSVLVQLDDSFIILICLFGFQIFKFITSELTLDLFVNICSYVFICLIYLQKYGFYLLQLENVNKYFHDHEYIDF
ncbi:uncharacterized protein LOC122517217 [Polistes fuscatus]|uniref:uncharacterized protein LOC122517217 n=1 Tax=Polistes fuscatus TaxID=30207 RepID=UPI001CAA2360|nr:uncharacterized protein LOC122517217 [Polistes fuscatus]